MKLVSFWTRKSITYDHPSKDWCYVTCNLYFDTFCLKLAQYKKPLTICLFCSTPSKTKYSLEASYFWYEKSEKSHKILEANCAGQWIKQFRLKLPSLHLALLCVLSHSKMQDFLLDQIANNSKKLDVHTIVKNGQLGMRSSLNSIRLGHKGVGIDIAIMQNFLKTIPCAKDVVQTVLQRLGTACSWVSTDCTPLSLPIRELKS